MNKKIQSKRDDVSVIKKTDVTSITLDSIKGYEEEKKEINKFINLLQNFDVYKEKGIYVPRGLILQGPPGCGKTLFAKAIATSCNLHFYNFQADSSGEKTLNKLIETFKIAREDSPSIIYIDEIDKLVGRRYFSSDIVRSLTQFLLTELDGLDTKEGLMLIASTNEYNSIPESLLRSGRMDKRIKIGYPDTASRYEILKFYTESYPQFSKIDMKKLALKCEGLSGADIKTIVNNTLINCIDEKEFIDEDDFLRVITELNFEDIGRKWKNKRALQDTIIHECGHAVVSYVLTGNHGSINCLKYGNTAGHTSFELHDVVEDESCDEIDDDSDLKDAYERVDKESLLNSIMISLGGIMAEEVFFNKHFTGGESDIHNVFSYFSILSDNFFLGIKTCLNKITYNRVVKRLLKKLMRKTKKIIKKNEGLILFISSEVQNHEDVLSYEQLHEVIDRYEREIKNV